MVMLEMNPSSSFERTKLLLLSENILFPIEPAEVSNGQKESGIN